jgi:hypothetical protein
VGSRRGKTPGYFADSVGLISAFGLLTPIGGQQSPRYGERRLGLMAHLAVSASRSTTISHHLTPYFQKLERMFRSSLLTPAEIRSKLLTVSQAGARRSPAGLGLASCTLTAEYDARIDTRTGREEYTALLGVEVQSSSGVPAGRPPPAGTPAAFASHGWRLVLHPRGHAGGVVSSKKLDDASSPSGFHPACNASDAHGPFSGFDASAPRTARRSPNGRLTTPAHPATMRVRPGGGGPGPGPCHRHARGGPSP